MYLRKEPLKIFLKSISIAPPYTLNLSTPEEIYRRKKGWILILNYEVV